MNFEIIYLIYNSRNYLRLIARSSRWNDVLIYNSRNYLRLIAN